MKLVLNLSPNKERRMKMSKGLLNYIQNNTDGKKVDVTKWKKFLISEIFDVRTGAHVKRLNEGGTPRISVSGVNNGITGYYEDVADDNYRIAENFISFSFLGTCFYHPYRASLDMKVHILSPKDYNLNKYSGLFIVSVLKRQFNGTYGNQMSSSDLKKEFVLLPEKDGNPDWHKMEEMIKPFYSDLEKLVV